MAESTSTHNEACADAGTGTTCTCHCNGARHGEGMTAFRAKTITDRAKDVATKGGDKAGSRRDWKAGKTPDEIAKLEVKGRGDGTVDGMRPPALGTYAARRDRVKEIARDVQTRTNFDALPEAEQARVLAELRAIADAGDTSTTRDRTYGGIFRGDANHVSTAKYLINSFTRKVEPVPDNSPKARAERIKGEGDRYKIRNALSGATIAQMEEISKTNGWGGGSSGWSKNKWAEHIEESAVTEGEPRPPKVDTMLAAHSMIDTLTADAAPDVGGVRAGYSEDLRVVETLRRYGPARRGSKDQYYRPMYRSLQHALAHLEKYKGDPAERALLRGLVEFYRKASR